MRHVDESPDVVEVNFESAREDDVVVKVDEGELPTYSCLDDVHGSLEGVGGVSEGENVVSHGMSPILVHYHPKPVTLFMV